jgi:hypothetical protein
MTATDNVPDVQAKPAAAGPDEKFGIVCICGPKNRQRVPWDGNREAVMEFQDKDQPWVKHRYRYTRMAGTEGDVTVAIEFMAYDGVV